MSASRFVVSEYVSRTVGRRQTRRINGLGALAAAAWMLAQAVSAFGQQPVQFAALPTRVPEVVARSTDLGHASPDRVLHVTVSLPFGDPAGVAAFVDSVSNPASPNYHQFLTPEQVGARFGLTVNQVQSVVDHLKSAGMKINLVGKNHLSILAEGTVAQAERAFKTSIREFQTLNPNEPGNARYFSYTTELTLPAAIASSVIDVSGLESFTKPQPRILTPTQTRTLYNLAPIYNAGSTGQNRTVGISNWDGYRLSNVPLYYSQYGLPTPPGGVGSNITVVTISGGSGAGSPGGEGDLDIQMVLGMAPLCNFRIYDGGSSDLIGVLTAEVNDNLCDTISESYGWNLSASTANAAHNLHLSMSAQGITYMAASGDSGTSLEPFSYPNYDPEVLMVGGTVASVSASGARVSEVAWNGGGGGWSTNTAAFNVLPSWQHGSNVPTTINKRLCPDVALHSSGSGGAYFFYFNGSLASGSIGTSFASPVFAGSLAVAEQKIISNGGLPPNGAGKRRFGRIQDLFYSQNGRPDVWFDITSGSNGTLPNGTSSTATPAWDFCTGWGAINFDAFAMTQAGDCNSNGIPDDQDVANHTSPDCDANGVPDECQVPPICPTCADCQADGIPDKCQIPPICPNCLNCNNNAVPDACERDCNNSGRPDDCDVALGFSQDCQSNNIPDECELPPICTQCPDCNHNGVPDECDITLGNATDCDNNFIPDRCETDPALCGANCLTDCDHDFVPDACQSANAFSAQSPDLSPLIQPITQTYTLTAPPPAAGDVSLFFKAVGDIDGSSEFVAININGTPVGNAFAFSGFACPSYNTDTLIVPAATWNAAVAGGNATINMVPNPLVDGACGGSSYISVKVDYAASQGDCNGNGQLDACEIASGSATDCNNNGKPDDCDIQEGVLTDGDQDGRPDECQCNAFCPGDLDLDDAVDGRDVPAFLACLESGNLAANDCGCADMNGDLRLDNADKTLFVTKLLSEPDTLCP